MIVNLVIAAVVAVVSLLVALGGAALGAWWARRDAHRRAAEDHSGVDRALERIERLDAELRRTFDAVDKLVETRVGGLTEVVGEKVTGMSSALDQQVGTINAELAQVRRLVAELQKEKERQSGQLVAGLRAVTEQQKVLAETTQSLREALANPQVRGQWGERMADDVLRAAGLRENVNYLRQQTLPGGTRPDFTFLMPDGQTLHMDVKFPVHNYLRFLESEHEAEASTARTQFLRDVRARVKELAGRGYTDADSTVGFVLLFIPNESIYAFVHEHDPDLLDHALAHKVVLCSPSTLFAVLGVVRQAVDNLAVERASRQMLEVLARFGDQWERFVEHLEKVDRQRSTFNKSFDELCGVRRRKLQRTLEEVDELRERAGLEDGPRLVEGPSLRQVSGA